MTTMTITTTFSREPETVEKIEDICIRMAELQKRLSKFKKVRKNN